MEKHACPTSELSCIIGSLFIQLDPPCCYCGRDELVICGTTYTGHKATLTIKDGGVFYFDGRHEDLAAVMGARCPQRHRGGRCCEYG